MSNVCDKAKGSKYGLGPVHVFSFLCGFEESTSMCGISCLSGAVRACFDWQTTPRAERCPACYDNMVKSADALEKMATQCMEVSSSHLVPLPVTEPFVIMHVISFFNEDLTMCGERGTFRNDRALWDWMRTPRDRRCRTCLDAMRTNAADLRRLAALCLEDSVAKIRVQNDQENQENKDCCR